MRTGTKSATNRFFFDAFPILYNADKYICFQRIQILLSEIRKLRRKISLDKKEGKTEVDKSKKNTPGGRGRKRQRSSENEKEEVKVEEEEEEEKKSGKAVVGVNRRNAVLFTRKKAATEEKEDKITKRNDRKDYVF